MTSICQKRIVFIVLFCSGRIQGSGNIVPISKFDFLHRNTFTFHAHPSKIDIRSCTLSRRQLNLVLLIFVAYWLLAWFSSEIGNERVHMVSDCSHCPTHSFGQIPNSQICKGSNSYVGSFWG